MEHGGENMLGAAFLQGGHSWWDLQSIEDKTSLDPKHIARVKKGVGTQKALQGSDWSSQSLDSEKRVESPCCPAIAPKHSRSWEGWTKIAVAVQKSEKDNIHNLWLQITFLSYCIHTYDIYDPTKLRKALNDCVPESYNALGDLCDHMFLMKTKWNSKSSSLWNNKPLFKVITHASVVVAVQTADR